MAHHYYDENKRLRIEAERLRAEAELTGAEIERLRTQCEGLAQSAINNGEGLLKFEMALKKIAELRYSEAGEPFDDALDIADRALA